MFQSSKMEFVVAIEARWVAVLDAVSHRVICHNSNQVRKVSKSFSRANGTVMATVYTYSEVSKHNSLQDCWIAVNGKVYDITKFVDDHPGGDEVLFPLRGRDATDDFETVGHSDNARKIMTEFEIGEFENSAITQSYGKPEYNQEKSCNFITRIWLILLPLAILASALALRFPKVKEALTLVS